MLRPWLLLIQMLYYCAEQHLIIHKDAFFFDKGVGPHVLCSKVGGIVLGRLMKLIIMPSFFLSHKGFSFEYYLFKSELLNRIIFVSTGQGSI